MSIPAAAPAPKEDDPITETMKAIHTAYGTNGANTSKEGFDGIGTKKDYIVDYEPLKFSSFRVCCVCQGTVFQDPIILVEQILLTMVFFGCAAPVWWFFNQEAKMLHDGKKGHIDVSQWISVQEPLMRQFAMIMTMLATFLLSFYTSIIVGRWWVMRTGGVGGIKAATVDLELLIYQNVTQEEEVLSAVRRYGRTSLMLMFYWRQDNMKNMKRGLTSIGLLTEHEADQLLKWNHCLHETIWAWQSGIVTMLYKEGKVKSDQLFHMLLEKCLDGRSAAQLVHTHLAVRAPMQYVHLLGLLVKMHNTILAIIMGILFGAAVRNAQTILCIQLFLRTLLLPFLFNAILMMNAALADPFSGDESDFPGPIYQDTLDKDCKGLVSATQNMPEWLEKRASKV